VYYHWIHAGERGILIIKEQAITHKAGRIMIVAGDQNRRIIMKIRPLNDRILVVRIGETEKTTGGIIIPDTAKEKPQEGKVVAVGPGKWDDNGKRVPLEVKKGDRVLFGKYAGNEIKIDEVEHLMMREDDILGIIEK
jgi:chaperonin GroES